MEWAALLVFALVLWGLTAFILPSGVSSPALEAMPRYKVGRFLFVIASVLFAVSLFGIAGSVWIE